MITVSDAAHAGDGKQVLQTSPGRRHVNTLVAYSYQGSFSFCILSPAATSV